MSNAAHPPLSLHALHPTLTSLSSTPHSLPLSTGAKVQVAYYTLALAALLSILHRLHSSDPLYLGAPITSPPRNATSQLIKIASLGGVWLFNASAHGKRARKGLAVPSV